jgi:hypothetical protein
MPFDFCLNGVFFVLIEVSLSKTRFIFCDWKNSTPTLFRHCRPTLRHCGTGGARFFEGARVDKVLTKNGGVVGVRMENGHVIEVWRTGHTDASQLIMGTRIPNKPMTANQSFILATPKIQLKQCGKSLSFHYLIIYLVFFDSHPTHISPLLSNSSSLSSAPLSFIIIISASMC